MMEDDIERAADLLYSAGSRGRTLNIKFGSPSQGARVTAADLARQVIEGEEAIRSGRARLVRDID